MIGMYQLKNINKNIMYSPPFPATILIKSFLLLILYSSFILVFLQVKHYLPAYRAAYNLVFNLKGPFTYLGKFRVN